MLKDILKKIQDFFTTEGCYKQRERDGIATFGMCGGLVGGDSSTDFLQYACVTCKYYVEIYDMRRENMEKRDYVNVPWIGVDLDGTLAYYDKWKGLGHIGEPIPEMKQRVLAWLSEGKEVRIFTARVCPENDVETARYYIEQWCLKNLGVVLPITCIKDFSMIELWDDRCVQVIKNEGRPILTVN